MAQVEYKGLFRPLRTGENLNGISFSPDNKMFATISYENKVNIWNTKTGKVDVIPEVTTTDLIFSSDSSRLIIQGYPLSEIVILDPANGKLLANIGEPGGIETVNVAPDGRTVTSFGNDGTFRGWDALTGQEQWRRKTERSYIKTSRDGKRFAELSTDRKSVEIGEIGTGHFITKASVEPYAFWHLVDNGHSLLINSRQLTDKTDSKHKHSIVEQHRANLSSYIKLKILFSDHMY